MRDLHRIDSGLGSACFTRSRGRRRNYHNGNCTGCVTLDIWKIFTCGIRQSYLLSFDPVWPTVVEKFMITRWEYGNMVLVIEQRLWTRTTIVMTLGSEQKSWSFAGCNL